jgi:hypothetical protein
LADSELDSSMTFHEFGSENELQLAELDYIPGAEAVIHKHDDDEEVAADELRSRDLPDGE